MERLLRGHLLFPQGERVRFLKNHQIRVSDAGQVMALEPSPEPVPDHLLLPGMIDCHNHFPQMDMIGMPSGQLLSWLENYTFREEQKYAAKDFCRAQAQLFGQRLLDAGTTTTCTYTSNHIHAPQLFAAGMEALGLRAIVGRPSMDRMGPEPLCVEVSTDISHLSQFVEAWHGKNQQVFAAVTPRFALSCSDMLLEQLGDFFNLNSERQLFCQTHLSENHDEIRQMSQRFPMEPNYTSVYERFKLLGPRTILAHCIHCSAEEWQIIVEQSCLVAHCPSSNSFLGSGLFPMARALKLGAVVGLGSDVAGGTHLSMWQVMGEAYKVGMLRQEPVGFAQLFRAATQIPLVHWGMIHQDPWETGAPAHIQQVAISQVAGLAQICSSDSVQVEEVLGCLSYGIGVGPQRLWIGSDYVK